MKIRTGFVSNSSSSSYIIAYKMSAPCEHCGRSDLDIASMFSTDRGYGDDTNIRANGADEVIAELKDFYEIDDTEDVLDKDDAEYKKEQFALFAKTASKLSKYLDGHYKIVWLNVSYGDDDMFKALKKQHKDLEIIEDWR